jgi:hypothetical protein
MIFSETFKLKWRRSEKDFTRNRLLPFPNLVLFISNMIKRSLQTELVAYFSHLGNDVVISKSAFSQSRQKLKAEAFLDLLDGYNGSYYEDGDYQKWNSYRLSAIDSSTGNLPVSDEIIQYFNSIENRSDCPMPAARISTCFDLLNEIIIDPIIAPYNCSEYELAISHLKKLNQNDLVIFDRGYTATWLFSLLFSRKINFVTRIPKRLFVSFWKYAARSQIIQVASCPETSNQQLCQLGLQFKPFEIRLVKVTLSNGETEVLATSLLSDELYPTEIFGELYHLRWGTEQNYNHLKNHIQIENFSGKTVEAVKQDFYANVLFENIRSVIAAEAQEEVDNDKIDAKYEYKVNKNLSLGFLKDRFVDLLMNKNQNSIKEIIKLFILVPNSIRPGRHYKRKIYKSLRKYPMNYRRAI